MHAWVECTVSTHMHFSILHQRWRSMASCAILCIYGSEIKNKLTNSQFFFSVTLHNYVTKRRKLAVMSYQSDEATYCSSEMSLKNLWVCFPVFHPYIKLGKRNIFTEVLLDIPKWIYSWIWEMMDIQKKTFSEWKNVSERQICLLKSSQ